MHAEQASNIVPIKANTSPFISPWNMNEAERRPWLSGVSQPTRKQAPGLLDTPLFVTLAVTAVCAAFWAAAIGGAVWLLGG